MPATKDKHVISSFAAPTEEDLAYLASLSFEEQRALVHAELDKGFEGEPVPLSEDFIRSIHELIDQVAAADGDKVD